MRPGKRTKPSTPVDVAPCRFAERRIGTGVNRRPAGAIIEAAPLDNVAAFQPVHLIFVQCGNEALNLEVAEFKFFFCHTITEQFESEQSEKQQKVNSPAGGAVYQIFGKVRFLTPPFQPVKMNFRRLYD